MFWGLIMEPKRRYTQVVKRPFHISMAALDIFSSNDAPCQVLLDFEDRNYLLCTLQKDKNVQTALDLNFESGSVVAFATNGDSNVHLTGYLIDEDNLEDIDEEESEAEEEVSDIVTELKKRKKAKALEELPRKKSRTEQLLDEADNYDSNDDESFSISQIHEEEDDVIDEDGDSDLSDDSEENDDDVFMGDEDGPEEEDEDDENEVSSMSEDEEEKPQVNGVASKKKQKQKGFEEKQKPPKRVKKQEKGKTENIQKTAKTENIQRTPKTENSPKAGKNKASPLPQKRVLEGGVIVQDIVVGDGQIVKPGKLAEVYYEGRLKQNNKIFDKLRQGTGFKFRVGKQEVIKGWDVGVAGMKIGGKRRIVCPPNMAYGAKGSAPQIPPNSTLVFEVELKNVK